LGIRYAPYLFSVQLASLLHIVQLLQHCACDPMQVQGSVGTDFAVEEVLELGESIWGN